MYSRRSLIIILLALALSVIGPYLSVQGAMAVTNGRSGKGGDANFFSTARGGIGGLHNTGNSGKSANGNGGDGGFADDHSSARGGTGGSSNQVLQLNGTIDQQGVRCVVSLNVERGLPVDVLIVRDTTVTCI